MLHGDEGFKLSTARGLLQGAQQTDAVPTLRPDFQEVFKLATTWMRSPQADLAILQDAAAVLGYSDYDSAAPVLLEAIDGQPLSVQVAALAALDRLNDPRSTSELLKRFPKFPPRLQAETIATLIKRRESKLELLAAIKRKELTQSNLSAMQVNQLLADADSSVRDSARQILSPPAKRSTVVESFRPAFDLPGDATRGHLLYQQRCISCHRTPAEGNLVGPDLVTVRNSGKEKLLTNILDPNREVAPNYLAYSIETHDGQSLLGIITTDTPTYLTLRQAYAKDITIPRSNIKRMTSQHISLMPDGLEKDLKQQDVADLLEFLSTLPPSKTP
jgi:putative heme-binding domain-containing protein